MAVKKRSNRKPAAKKTVKARSVRSKKKSSFSLGRELIKVVTAVSILVLVVLTLAMVADFWLDQRHGPMKKASRQKSAQTRAEPEPSEKRVRPVVKKPLTTKGDKRIPAGKIAEAKPVFEVFDHDAAPLVREVKPDFPDKGPLVAIIIDDVGFDREAARQFAELDSHITLALLPGAPHGRVIAETLHSMGVEVMLHLPMEPMEYPRVNPGPGALLSTMEPDRLISVLRQDLDAVPHVRGVNNHMGSRLTSLSPQMHQIFTVLKARGLFFIDSRTTRHSLCRSSARLLRVPFAQRDVFLDNIQKSGYIKKQLAQLVDVAQRHGTAIGIGHPYKATYATLRAEMQAIKSQVTLVPASALVDISG